MVTIPGKGREEGKLLRKLVPRSSHSNWTPAPNRRSPVEMIFGQDSERLEGLVPYRHQRMSESPFAFFRGAARIMAADLASTPVSGLMAQICGDAHLSNFGLFGSPERDLVFDLNDFDETLTGPWEWDLKRLAASLVVASRHNRFKDKEADNVVKVAVRYYSETMADLATLPAIDIRYSHVRAEDIPSFLSKSLSLTPSEAKKLEKNQKKLFKKARTRDSHQALSKLAVKVDGHYQLHLRSTVPRAAFGTPRRSPSGPPARNRPDRFRGLPSILARFTTPSSRSLRVAACRIEGRRCWQCRYALLCGVVRRAWSRRPADTPGERSRDVGTCGVS